MAASQEHDQDVLAESRNWLLSHGRPLEKRLLEHFIEGAPAGPALAALGGFQNDDGGFGRALEPDIRSDASSALATTVALQWLVQLPAGEDDPRVSGAASWLREQFLDDFTAWQIIPVETQDAPHAPWWTWDGDIRRMGANPRAEILGYMYAWPNLYPEEMRERVLEQVLQQLEGEGADIEMHDLLCYLRLLDARGLPLQVADHLRARLGPLSQAALDASSGLGYGLSVLQVVPSPHAALADLFADDIGPALERLIDQRQPEGYWQPTWTWGSAPEPAWAEAEADWRIVLTLDSLLILARHGALTRA